MLHPQPARRHRRHAVGLPQPVPDNGFKLFGPDGFKLSDEAELAIEEKMENGGREGRAAPADLGRAMRLEDAPGRYIEYVKHTFPEDRTLDGVKVVVDCANGAAYGVAPTVLTELGAEVVAIGIEPDGFNINAGCGSTAPERMQEAVVRHGAGLGIALDGDADRLVMADETGALLDGDQLMAVIAESWHASGRLKGGGVVATVMSNLGFENYLGGIGLGVDRTQVGDRYVVERMVAAGYNVGGEQSGHIILTDFCTTGDALVAAMQTLSAVVEKRRPVSEVGRAFEPLPQLLRSVGYRRGAPLENEEVRRTIAGAEARLGRQGRVLVRNSGTEPVVRVMAEAPDEALVVAVVEEIIAAVERAGAPRLTCAGGFSSPPVRIPAAAPASRPISRR